jgi:divalent metal cation (Fe/Co/Zn/Cd) transporter
MKSLLIGESASDEDLDTIRQIVYAHDRVRSLISLRGLQYGPDELLVEAQVAFDDDLTFRDIARAIDDIEAEVRARVPGARLVAIEPAVPQPSDPDVPHWQQHAAVTRGR